MSSKVLGNLKKGLVFVLSAPAGTGKTTLVRMLREEFSCVRESISCTTRAPRQGELQGKDYHFLTREAFQEKVKKEAFLEYADVFGDCYGTSKEYVAEELSKGHHVILVIDTQGAMQIKEKIPAIFVFVSPPSFDELKERLLKRKTETPEKIERRLLWAKKEMEMIPHYDYHIVNDHLHTAYTVLKSILIAEEHRTKEEKSWQ